VCDPELRTQISDAAIELGAVVQLDVVDPEANIVQQIRIERVAPVDDIVVDWSLREARSQQCKRIERGIVLLGMGIAAENMIVPGGVEVDFYVVLTGIDLSGLGVTIIGLRRGSDRSRIKRRGEQSACYRINRFHSCNVVVENGGVPVQRVIELVSRVVADACTCEALGTNVREVASPLRRCKDAEWKGGGRMVKPLRLIIKEEEQLVLEDGAANGSAEHIPPKFRPGISIKPIFPRVRVEHVI